MAPQAPWHFHMYLVKLYRENKGWFVIVILFALGQVFINYKNGVMFSPFYNYDMYSYTTLPKSQYEVAQIRVNGKLLQPKNFSLHEWDNLIQPLYFWYKQNEWNSAIFNTEVTHFLPVKDSGLYINHVAENTFNYWYAKQVLRIANVTDTTSRVTVSKDSFLLAQQYLYRK